MTGDGHPDRAGGRRTASSHRGAVLHHKTRPASCRLEMKNVRNLTVPIQSLESQVLLNRNLRNRQEANMREDFPGLPVRSGDRQLDPPQQRESTPSPRTGSVRSELLGPPSEEPSDHSLIGRSRAGDQNAATRLYARYAKRLTGLVKKALSCSPGTCRGR